MICEVTKLHKKSKRNIFLEKLNVAAYVRVSTKNEKQITSFESQQNYYKAKIEQNENWNFVGLYSDEGISGSSFYNRNEFIRLMRDALNGKVDLIFTKSVSRFARNTVDSLDFIRKLKRAGVGIIFEEENINTLDISGEMLLTVFSAVAQMELSDHSRRLSYGLKMKLESSEYKVASLPYGYRRDNLGNIKIDVKASHIIKKIYEMYNHGYSMNNIRDYLNKKKIPSPKDKEWSVYSVRYLLKNIAYTGTLEAENNYGEGQVYKIDNYYPIIIPKNEFEQIQKILEAKNEFRAPIKSNDDLYSKRLRCGFCYSTMIKTYEHSWKCYKALKGDCKGKQFDISILESGFMELCNQLIISDPGRQIVNTNKLLDSLQKEKRVIENKIIELSDKLINKEIYNVNFDKEYAILYQRITKIKLREDELLEDKKKIENDISYFKKLIASIKRKYDKKYDFILFTKIIEVVVIGSYHDNNRADNFHLRFISKKNIDEFMKVDNKFIEQLQTNVILDFYMKKDFSYVQNYKTRNIHQVHITFEIKKEI